ncbi:9724_t:CDS:1, partial [Cetraspora pellucida]
KSAQNRIPIKNPTKDNPYIEEVENLLMQEETQDININKIRLQEQKTEENISDYDMNSKTNTVYTEISIKNNLNIIQRPVINNIDLENT